MAATAESYARFFPDPHAHARKMVLAPRELQNVLLTTEANLQGPTAMPAFNAAGFNTSTYAYPDTDHGHDVFYNEYQDIEVREYRIGMFLWRHAKCVQNRNAA